MARYFLDYFPKDRIEIIFQDDKNNTRDVRIKLFGTSQKIKKVMEEIRSKIKKFWKRKI